MGAASAQGRRVGLGWGGTGAVCDGEARDDAAASHTCCVRPASAYWPAAGTPRTSVSPGALELSWTAAPAVLEAGDACGCCRPSRSRPGAAVDCEGPGFPTRPGGARASQKSRSEVLVESLRLAGRQLGTCTHRPVPLESVLASPA
ncbi:hypothetical protein P7K49_025061 [Saguinus oedipus]|uniref:Uncharacterized protein n=1 Tax=Saguinus oedipus TaxID=9490 RepID=A0ABQ9UG06_SAGOE|nr:hypothetical protein P7K49_025061 [Saguinus oedipus]